MDKEILQHLLQKNSEEITHLELLICLFKGSLSAHKRKPEDEVKDNHEVLLKRLRNSITSNKKKLVKAVEVQRALKGALSKSVKENRFWLSEQKL